MRDPRRWLRFGGLLLAAVLLLILFTAAAARFAPESFTAQAASGAVSSSLRAEVAGIDPSEPVAAFYRDHDARPLWTQGRRLAPDAGQVLSLIEQASDDGLDPSTYRPQQLRTALAAAASERPQDVARAELALSRAYAAYIVALRTPPAEAKPAFVDARLRTPPLSARAVLEDLAAAPSLEAGLAQARAMNSIYLQLRQALADCRGACPKRQQDLILANLARARALPQDLGRRFILVDVAAQKLWAYEDGQIRDSMDVVVGKPHQQTPVMTGLIRYAVFNPYWNIPDDLTRDTYAPRVLRQGVSYLEGEGMEVLSDWSPQPAKLDPASVDWSAVASGAQPVRLRQAPGPRNLMGEVKLMLPNGLGIYLHDTPQKWLFANARRTGSAGCVRLADAMRLTRWLFGYDVAAPSADPEVRVDLPEPTPVYITYFTVAPSADGLEQRADIYGRDGPLLAALDRSRTGPKLAARSIARAAAPSSAS